MDVGFWAATLGGVYQMRRLERTAVRLAHVQGAGFLLRRERIALRGPSLRQLVFEASLELSPRGVHRTGNPLDLALEGRGWFAVQAPQGVLWTRKGDLRLGPGGELLTQEGFRVLGERGPLVVREGFRVDVAGNVWQGKVLVDRLRVRDFAPSQLRPVGDYYLQASGSGRPAEARVLQGYLEESGVNPVREAVRLIEELRAFEAYQRVMRSVDEAGGWACGLADLR